jgi:hypothetical protein
MKIRAKTLAILLLPVLVLGAWTLRLYWQGTSGVTVELPVEGFDPRDPISGHYVTYRLAMGLHDPCRPGSGGLIDRQAERCLCFDARAQPEPSWAGSCADKPMDCSLYLKGTCEWSGFMVGVERFYIPEADSAWLKVVPPKSRVRLTLTGSGKAMVKEFLPEGQKYKAWIERKKAEQKSVP